MVRLVRLRSAGRTVSILHTACQVGPELIHLMRHTVAAYFGGLRGVFQNVAALSTCFQVAL
jgi:hypothetical protein